MKPTSLLGGFLITASVLTSTHASAALITFDTVVSGATEFGFDGDGDTIDDVLFSTTDPLGFNTFGPGANQSFISEPGIEGTAELTPDLRVDFLNGASGTLQFGFAVNVLAGGVSGPTFSVFDATDTLLGSETALGEFTATTDGTSSFPEGLVSVSFAGTAAYASFDFGGPASRYIIDNFEGTFGSTEDIGGESGTVPVPATLFLLGFGLLGLGWSRRKQS